ncbi:MAG: 2OG-Fe(II) oxygenase [Dokdonella sp.]|uniref:2OG-Fe(II) oxygenase n=1 Tax=Dokdonella sp. TaxID=2291710 RepID=UPI0025BA2D66|nr:2OG-Fe(II) oxygenase [Dokdonella sp.]MBZ0223722.1 2OG-Fe(II) oxygenase [Dokdonella sp.]MCC7256469.1 2OG-Fe(II) oxygenase [Dokdonella sp.]
MSIEAAPDFIETYADALPAQACAEILAAYAASDKIVRGATGGGVNTTLKDSWDITISRHPEWKNVENALNTAVMRNMLAYVRKYPFLALAPLMLSKVDPKTGEQSMLDGEHIRAMGDAQLQGLIAQLFRPGEINIQRYLGDVGGYPYWHSETSPRAGDNDRLHRVLLWTLYLNEGFDEGETEFYFQHKLVKPKTGLMAIAPAGFTHTHRGNRPKGGDKYIATSWILFQPAEKLYAAPPRKS